MNLRTARSAERESLTNLQIDSIFSLRGLLGVVQAGLLPTTLFIQKIWTLECGRAKGTPNRSTIERRLRAQEGIAAAVQTGRLPLDIMLTVARGGLEADKISDRQLQAAIAAAPYVHPKLAAMSVHEATAPDPARDAKRKQVLAFIYKKLDEMAKPEPLAIEHADAARSEPWGIDPVESHK